MEILAEIVINTDLLVPNNNRCTHGHTHIRTYAFMQHVPAEQSEVFFLAYFTTLEESCCNFKDTKTQIC